MNQNSEEFYKQKYLKYKHKYLEAQRLYGEELEGGGTNFWLAVPPKVYNLIKDTELFRSKKYTSLNALYFLLGVNSLYAEVKGKDIYSTLDKKKVSSFTTALGVKDKKYSDDEAIRQFKENKPTYGFLKINDYAGSSGGEIKVTQAPPPKVSETDTNL
jgi:hypothetical protein